MVCFVVGGRDTGGGSWSQNVCDAQILQASIYHISMNIRCMTMILAPNCSSLRAVSTAFNGEKIGALWQKLWSWEGILGRLELCSGIVLIFQWVFEIQRWFLHQNACKLHAVSTAFNGEKIGALGQKLWSWQALPTGSQVLSHSNFSISMNIGDTDLVLAPKSLQNACYFHCFQRREDWSTLSKVTVFGSCSNCLPASKMTKPQYFNEYWWCRLGFCANIVGIFMCCLLVQSLSWLEVCGKSCRVWKLQMPGCQLPSRPNSSISMNIGDADLVLVPVLLEFACIVCWFKVWVDWRSGEKVTGFGSLTLQLWIFGSLDSGSLDL